MWWIWLIVGLVAGSLFMYFLLTFIISCIIYTKLFVRTSKEKWSRTVSWPDKELQTMFDEGKKWGEENEKYRKHVEIDSCGFHLVGEYFDFGFDKAVIIIPGRSESGTYSYYFSEPYKKSGYNVLAIDNRCHGLSEGKYNTLGLKEYKDIANWADLLDKEFGIKHVHIHGICIGSATGIHLLAKKDYPSNLKGITCEGTYTTFKELFDNQLKKRNKPTFPYTFEVLSLVSLRAGKSLKRNSPIREIDKVKVPVLFLYSKQDSFAKPDQSMKLFNKVTAPKHLEWFPVGEHSHIRFHNTKEYDTAIERFLKEYC